jgi:hypothetical protein
MRYREELTAFAKVALVIMAFVGILLGVFIMVQG